MKKNVKQSNDSSRTRIATEVGAGVLTAGLLAAAGAYLLSGKEGKERRAKMKVWAVKAQKEVAEKVKMAREMGGDEYKRIVDAAVKHYGALQKANGPEMIKVAKEMKAEWARMHANAKKMTAMVKKDGKAVKKTAKKTVKNK